MFKNHVIGAKDISIHALVKRATFSTCGSKCCASYFNPRPREEGDRRYYFTAIDREHFNPRPREEGDMAQSFPTDRPPLFQSTPS